MYSYYLLSLSHTSIKMYYIIYYYYSLFLAQKLIDSLCLTDENRDKYSSTDVIPEWERSFCERSKAIEAVKRLQIKSDCVYHTIIRSFPCLTQPLIINLVS